MNAYSVKVWVAEYEYLLPLPKWHSLTLKTVEQKMLSPCFVSTLLLRIEQLWLLNCTLSIRFQRFNSPAVLPAAFAWLLSHNPELCLFPHTGLRKFKQMLMIDCEGFLRHKACFFQYLLFLCSLLLTSWRRLGVISGSQCLGNSK